MAHDAPLPDPSPPPLAEELVAYLDGELDAEACRRIEERLVHDEQARQMLRELEQTWQWLGELGQATIGETFTHSTLEMVAMAAEAEVQQRTARGGRRRWLLGVGSLVLAAAVGFLSVVWLRPDPHRALLDDLPVLENLDEYRQVGDLEFLRQLEGQGLFAQEDGHGG